MRNQSWKLEHNNALPYIMIYKNMLRQEVKNTTLLTEHSTKLLQIKLDRIVKKYSHFRSLSCVQGSDPIIKDINRKTEKNN